MTRLVALIRRLSRSFAVMSAGLTMVVMALTSIDVLSRASTGRSVPGLLEIGEIALVLLVYLGIAHAQQTKTHVAVSIVTARMPRALARAVIIGGLVTVGLILLWVVYATGVLALESAGTGEVRYGITAVPIWPARVLIPVGFILLLLEFAIDIFEFRTDPNASTGEAGATEVAAA